jgi:mannose-6-phosphate isomerase-like protein (cupin superfamily)
MIRFWAVSGLAACLAMAGAAWGEADSNGVYASATDLKALTDHLPAGQVTSRAPSGPGVTLLAARRDRPGEVELHLAQNDQFIAQSGHATVRVGGTLSGQRQTAPGEFRGGTILGGRDYQLAPGDILWIPAGAPHQVTPKGGIFRYLAFKFDASPTK